MRARFLLAIVPIVSCQRPEAIQPSIEDESRQARTEIEAAMANWGRWLAEGKIDSMASVFTEDVQTLPPNQPLLTGRAAWLAAFRQQLTQGKVSIENITESVVAYGPVAVERGRYVLSSTPPSGAPANVRATSDTGKYLWHWRKVDGQWQVAQAAWNSNRPPTP